MLQHTKSSWSIACEGSVKCGVYESIDLGTRAGSSPECARRESSVVSLGTNDLVRVFMSHVPQQGFVNIADSRAFLTRSTAVRHFLKGVRKGAFKKMRSRSPQKRSPSGHILLAYEAQQVVHIHGVASAASGHVQELCNQ